MSGRGFVLAMVGALSIVAGPARAEFPPFLTVEGAIGPGWGHWKGQDTGGFGAVGRACLAWRTGPRRAWTLSAHGGVIEHPGKRPPSYLGPVLDRVRFASAVIGLERSRRRTASGPFMQVGVGPARIGGDCSRGLGWETGAAVDAGFGYRIAPPPGPVGFILAARTHHVIAAHARAHTLTFGVGLTVYPQSPGQRRRRAS